jgi:hypothetical protein
MTKEYHTKKGMYFHPFLKQKSHARTDMQPTTIRHFVKAHKLFANLRSWILASLDRHCTGIDCRFWRKHIEL